MKDSPLWILVLKLFLTPRRLSIFKKIGIGIIVGLIFDRLTSGEGFSLPLE